MSDLLMHAVVEVSARCAELADPPTEEQLQDIAKAAAKKLGLNAEDTKILCDELKLPDTTNWVTVTLRDGRVIEDDLFDVDVTEGWFILLGHEGDLASNTIAFDNCVSVVDQAGNDLLKQWTDRFMA